MTIICIKCDKIFKRNIDLNRHINRKIPCDRKLECNRCFKNFNQKCDLLNHINKINKCHNKRSEMEIQTEIKIKNITESEMKIKELDKENENLKLQLQLKELELKLVPKRKPNILIYNNYININIGDFKEVPIKTSDIENLISNQDSKEVVIQKLSKFMFNNKAHPNNQCLVSYQGNVFGILNGQFHEYVDIVPHVNMLFQKQCCEISRSLEDNKERFIRQNNRNLIKESNYNNITIKSIPEFINNESEQIIEPSLKKL
jgi:uncharacterized C2H2 Zn-finger protein